MIEKLQKEIDGINNNIQILPTKTKKNKTDYDDYLDEQINCFNEKLNEVKREISKRYGMYKQSLISYNAVPKKPELNIKNIFSMSDVARSIDKMELDYYFYELGHFYQNDLEKINNIIFKLINIFYSCNIKLKVNNFNYTEVVHQYIKSLLNEKDNIHRVFSDLYWKNPRIIVQIELNFRYLFFKYKRKIDRFYCKYFKNKNLNEYLNNYYNDLETIYIKNHNNIKYLTDLFFNNEISVNDLSEKNINALKEAFKIEDLEESYNYLKQLSFSLEEYKNFMEFEYIISDMKTLYEGKQEYKSLYNNKLKEIKKIEKKIFGLNRKFKTTSMLFAKDKGNIKLLRDNNIDAVYELYRELDELSIKDIIYNNIDDDTSYADVLKIAALNFPYFVKTYKSIKDDVTADELIEKRDKLIDFIFGSKQNIINNISITQNKNISQIIYDKYKLFNIVINEEKLNINDISNYIKDINNMILYVDLTKNNIRVSDIDFIINVDKLVENVDDKK